MALEDRILEPTALVKLTEDYQGACQRVTGRPVEAWAEIFRRRRRRGYETGKFRGGIMLMMTGERVRYHGAASDDDAYEEGPSEVDLYAQHYGLDEADDFLVLRRVPVEQVFENRRRHRMPLPVIPQYQGRFADTLNVMMLNPEKYPR